MKRLTEYISRSPLSISRIVSLSYDGTIMYKTSKPSILHPFPKPGNPHLDAGVSRNFEIFDPLQFLAEFTQHIPNKGEHTVHHYGFYSNKNRSLRKKQPCENKERSSSLPQPEAYSEYSAKQRLSWAALIRCVFEINPLLCLPIKIGMVAL